MKVIKLFFFWILLVILSIIAPILWLCGYGMKLEFQHKSSMK